MRTTLLILALSSLASTAQAYTIAHTDPSDPESPELHWEPEDRVTFQIQYEGGNDLWMPVWESVVREGFGAWARVAEADIEFLQGPIFVGPACPVGTEDALAVCGETAPEDPDGHSVLYFMEQGWPYATEVIGLTVVSFTDTGQIVDADIAFNSKDWNFTWGDTDVDVDIRSIATHEIGHVLGLDHSLDDTATMFAEYQPGQTHLRSLEEDDRLGLAHLYPCADGLCTGDVAVYESSGCSLAAGAPAALGLLLVIVAVGRRRRGLLPLLALGLMVPRSGDSSIVEGLPAAELVQRADLVVRATVSDVTAYRSGQGVASRISLDVTEDLLGLAPEQIVLRQPGGYLPDEGLGSVAFGMPRFAEGEDVVVMLAWPEGGAPQVLGLSQGKFTVSEGRLDRDLGGLSLLLRQGVDVVTGVPGDLDGMRELVGR